MAEATPETKAQALTRSTQPLLPLTPAPAQVSTVQGWAKEKDETNGNSCEIL